MEDLREDHGDEGAGPLQAGGAVDTEEGQGEQEKLDAVARRFYGRPYAQLCPVRKGVCRTLLASEKLRLRNK